MTENNFKCVCGSVLKNYSLYCLTPHRKSKKHKRYVEKTGIDVELPKRILKTSNMREYRKNQAREYYSHPTLGKERRDKQNERMRIRDRKKREEML